MYRVLARAVPEENWDLSFVLKDKDPISGALTPHDLTGCAIFAKFKRKSDGSLVVLASSSSNGFFIIDNAPGGALRLAVPNSALGNISNQEISGNVILVDTAGIPSLLMVLDITITA